MVGKRTAALSVLVFALTGSALAFAKSPHATEPTIHGTWIVSVTGEGLPDWYRALATFGRGGTLIETVTDPKITTGHGSWVKTGPREVAITTRLLQFDDAGEFIGTLKARADLVLTEKGKEFTSDRYLFEFIDRDGNLVTSGEGTAHGSRLGVGVKEAAITLPAKISGLVTNFSPSAALM